MARMNRMALKQKLLEEWLEVAEVAAELNVTTTCVVANYIKGGQGALPAFKKNGRWRVHRDDLRAFKKLKRPHGLNVQYRQNAN